METWKQIKGFGNLYQISDLGRIKSFHKGGGEILNPSFDGRYLKVFFKFNGQKKGYRVHNLIAEYFIPNPFNFNNVLHLDGNKLNNKISNLAWGNDTKKGEIAYSNRRKNNEKNKMESL